MIFQYSIPDILKIGFEIINTIYFFLLFLIIIILYNIILTFFKDRIYLNAFLELKDPNVINIETLKEIPVVNIIIPAWKEGREFKECLLSIINLKYPNLKIIVNAGGNEETINIADSFKKHDNFLILKQSGGKEKASLGKIKALNECLNEVTEGILYFIDADCYLTDEILLRMLYPIVNLNEDVVISTFRPLKSQEGKNLIKYLLISRMNAIKKKYSRYNHTIVSGSNTCMTLDVIKAIGKFNQNRTIGEDISRAMDIISKGYRIYGLVDYRSRMYSAYPNNNKEFYYQKKRYLENSLRLSYKKKNKKQILRVFILTLGSIYLLIFPIFLFLSIGLFFIGICFIIHLYLTKLRKYIFFKKITQDKIKTNFRKIFFIKMFYFLYIDIFFNLLMQYNSIKYLSRLKKETIG